MRHLLKTHKSPVPPSSNEGIDLKDKYQEELRRQELGQHRLEEAMNRQETQTQRDQQLAVLDEWLNKQEKQR
jgi:hypothetical protein